MIKLIISRFTMKKQFCAFVDVVNFREVWVWKDKYNHFWLAHSKWGMRIRK